MKVIILDNIRSAYNVGAIFRTADGAGVDKIYLLGYTPAPTDRFGRVQAEIHKTSLGASETVAWQQVADVTALLAALADCGCVLVAVEQTATSIPLADLPELPVVAFVVGNEIDGVSKELIDAATHTVALPMLGTKESLNVAVAAGIILYHDLV